MAKVYPADWSFLLCEDMRQEENKKMTLVGVFPGNIIAVPADTQRAVLNLAAVWIFEDGVGTFKATAQLTGPSEFEPSSRSLMDATKNPNDPMIIALLFKPAPQMPLGRYVIRLNLDEKVYARSFEIRPDPNLRPPHQAAPL